MIEILLAAALQSQSDKLPNAAPIPAPSMEDQNVLVPVTQLLAAFQAGDSAAMLRLVYPDGRVTATGVTPTRTGVRQESWVQFAARVTPGGGWQETISDPAIEIDGDVAMVWAPYVVRVGSKVTCGFDHFDLVRDNGAWKVMNLTFSSRVSGCPE